MLIRTKLLPITVMAYKTKTKKASTVRIAKKAVTKKTARKANTKHTAVLKTPTSIKKHQSNYKQGAWMEYTTTEIAEIVAYKAKLATHYTNKTKSAKAIQDAHNYLDMLTAKTS